MSAYNLVFGTEIRFKVNGIYLKVKTVTSTVSLKKLDVSIVTNRDSRLDFLLLYFLFVINFGTINPKS